MNRHQREYLTKRLQEQFSAQVQEHMKKCPKEPDLNNHLIVAFSSGNTKFADIEVFKERMRQMVLNMADGDKLIEYSSRAWRSSDKAFLKIPPEYLIELPASYVEAMKKYEADLQEYNTELERLSALQNTLEMKIMLADDKALSNLISEAGNLIDLSLVNSQLLLQP